MEDRSLIVFDLETTGVDVAKDRIVELAATKYTPDLSIVIEKKRILVNPGMLIPPGATAIHGITNEMVAEKPSFKSYSKGIFDWFDGCNLAGFNIKRFDVPLMAEEFLRVGIKWPMLSVKILDAMEIFHKMEPRDLTGAAKFYLGKVHTLAHTGEGDNDVCVEVFKEQFRRYEDLKNGDILTVAEFCQGEFVNVDLAGHIILIEGVECFAGGRHKHKPLKDNYGYVKWMCGNSFPQQTKDIAASIVGLNR